MSRFKKFLIPFSILFASKVFGNLYEIGRSEIVNAALNRVQEKRLYSFLKAFSSYETRYHTSLTGIKSAHDLKEYWKQITRARSDISVKLIRHKSTPQPSIMVHIAGENDSRIILGGHIDSINDSNPSPLAKAPGAGDNAAGIAVLTETLKVLIGLNYKPKNSITLYGYAAEEVGLLGSEAISRELSNTSLKVLGVIQLDGVNYNKWGKDIVLISDYTNYFQNRFIGQLIDRYLGVAWGYDRCGYPCSDHYSWWEKGHPVSFPFESELRYENPKIHSEQDTVENMGNNANHAVLFAKLALAYIIEMDR